MNPNYLSSRWHNHTEKVYFKLKQCFVCTSLVLLSTKEKRHEYKNQSNKNPLILYLNLKYQSEIMIYPFLSEKCILILQKRPRIHIPIATNAPNTISHQKESELLTEMAYRFQIWGQKQKDKPRIFFFNPHLRVCLLI